VKLLVALALCSFIALEQSSAQPTKSFSGIPAEIHLLCTEHLVLAFPAHSHDATFPTFPDDRYSLHGGGHEGFQEGLHGAAALVE
jgi:hypothetical protein